MAAALALKEEKMQRFILVAAIVTALGVLMVQGCHSENSDSTTGQPSVSNQKHPAAKKLEGS